MLSIRTILPLRRETESELVAKGYRLASSRGLLDAKVTVREALPGETCRFGAPARAVVEVRATAAELA